MILTLRDVVIGVVCSVFEEKNTDSVFSLDPCRKANGGKSNGCKRSYALMFLEGWKRKIPTEVETGQKLNIPV